MNKQKIIQIITVSVISIIMYVNFVTVYYSIDAPIILELGYDTYAIKYSLCDGRIFMSGICLLANLVNIPMSIFYCICIITALIISAISVVKIYEIIQKIKPSESKLVKCILLIISYTYIFNFMSIDNMQFVESIVMAISIFLYIMASEKLIIEQKKLQALLLVVTSIFFYQGTINVFISFTFLLALLNHKKIDKEFIKDIFFAIAITAIASIVNVLFVSIIHKFIKSFKISRISFDILKNIKRNLKYISTLFIDSLELFPDWFFIAFIIIQLIVMGIYTVKNKEKNKLLKLISIILIYILSCLILTTIYPRTIHNGNGRMFSSIGELISAISIYMYCDTEIVENTKWLRRTLMVIICTYFVINFYNTFYLTFEAKKLNKFDKEYSEELLQTIEKYEEENNIKIKKMAYKYILKDGERPEIPKTMYSVSLKKVGSYNEFVFKLYTGRMIEKIKFDKEILEKYFSEEKEETIFIDDVVYFTIEY